MTEMWKESVNAIRQSGRLAIHKRFGLELTAEDFEELRLCLRKVDEAERRAWHTAG